MTGGQRLGEGQASVSQKVVLAAGEAATPGPVLPGSRNTNSSLLFPGLPGSDCLQCLDLSGSLYFANLLTSMP